MRRLVLIETSRDHWELSAVAFNPATAEECRVELADQNVTRRTAIVEGAPLFGSYSTAELLPWPRSTFAAIR